MKKISILFSLFVATLMMNCPANAQDFSNWTELKQSLEDFSVSVINFLDSITIDNEESPLIMGDKVINGSGKTIDGN